MAIPYGKLVEIVLQEFIDDLLSKYVPCDHEEFVSLLENHESIVGEIIEAAKSDYNVHFSESMQDGWYCIEQGNENYKVYHQERGRLGWGEKIVAGKCKAITAVLKASCYLSI